MPTHDIFVNWSKLTPPKLPNQSLHRQRVTNTLLESRNYRLTLLLAGAGYGKSTALAALSSSSYPIIWYQLQADDADPLRFLLHLLHGFSNANPKMSHTALARLEQWNHIEQPLDWRELIQIFYNDISNLDEEILLIFDDAHMLHDFPEIESIMRYLIDHAPSFLHVILSSRIPFNWNDLLTWRVRGQVLEIGEKELAFTVSEVDHLYRQIYKLPLSDVQSRLLTGKTDGWAMILPLIWQRLRLGNANSIHQALEQLSGSTGDLFNYLARETWNQQSPKVRNFLRETSILQELKPDICDCLRQKNDSKEILDLLRQGGFFLFGVDDVSIRYHHLFRELLQKQLSEEELKYLNIRAAHCYINFEKDQNAAIQHFLAAESFSDAASLLAEYGRQMIKQGRLEILAAWLEMIPAAVLADFPKLFIYLGDIARLHSRFEEAQGWYKEAENRFRETRDLLGLGQALRGQARVFLDTVNPRQAENLLEEALRISDGQEDRKGQARLLDLLAENRLNQGRIEEAQTLQNQARILRQQDRDEAAVPLRLLLRTGHLNQALTALEYLAAEEARQPVQRPRAHRETLLLLSLVLSFLGEQEKALKTAEKGTQRGNELDSQFVSAVGWMRQGHAWLLLKNLSGQEKAEEAYARAIKMSDQIQASRLKVEAYWGLVQVYGFRGQLQLAKQTADKGINQALQAGDEWVAACIRVIMGATFVLHNDQKNAVSWLKLAGDSFVECNDFHGHAVTMLWQSLLWRSTEDFPRLERDLEQLLTLVRDHNYHFLLLKRTLLGPPDPRVIVPLLLHARESGIHRGFAQHLLDQKNLGELQFHPGFQLFVQAFGSFRVWRGQEELSAKAWSRKKARQLFLLLLTYRQMQMHREQITGILWPELDINSAERDFKVAYNTLCNVLEPNRPRNKPSAFILRDGSRYGIRSEADLWFDVAEFDLKISAGDRALQRNPAAAQQLYRDALSLYQGDYLQEFPYEEWTNQERTRLLNRYLRTAERLGRSLVQEQKWEEVLAICHNLLQHDDCWEPAYQMLIIAYSNIGNLSEAIRTYRRCQHTLQKELDISPSSVTKTLYLDISNE